MMPNPSDPGTLATAVERTRDDLRRADATAGAYILILIGLGTIAAELGADLPRAVAVATTLAAAPAAITAGLALAVVKPRIHGGFAPGTWPHAAYQPGWTRVRDSFDHIDPLDIEAQQLWVFARIVSAKTRWLKRATVALAVTIGALVAIALYGAVSALI